MRAQMTALTAALALVSACEHPEDGEARRLDLAVEDAPLLGEDGRDSADHDCLVVLRTAEPSERDDGRLETRCIDGKCWRAWRVAMDVAESALEEGVVPRLLFSGAGDPEWRAVDAVATGERAGGYVRYAVEIAHHTIADGLSASAMNHAQVEMIPYLATAFETRIFDHNRRPGDFDNYALTLDDGFAIADAPTVCAPAESEPVDAVLRFSGGWTHAVEGVVRAGGRVRIDYDLSRLAQCHDDTYMGKRAWGTNVHVEFDSTDGLGEEPHSAPLVDCVDGDCSRWQAVPAFIDVPEGAQQMSLWFSTAGRSCRTHWDSQFGENYRFPVLSSVGWVGDFTYKASRAGGPPCADAGSLDEGAHYGTWARMRAIVSGLCFQVWQSGVTDWHNPDLNDQLDVSVVCHWDGEDSPRTHGVGFNGYVGHNAQFVFDPRGLDPFRSYRCPDVPVFDGADGVVARATCHARVNGEHFGPAGEDASFSLSFGDYRNDSWRAANCSPVGESTEAP